MSVATSTERVLSRSLARRQILGLIGIHGIGPIPAGIVPPRSAIAAQEDSPAASVVIDLPEEPRTLAQALVYDVNGSTLVHSIYDSLVQHGPTGELESCSPSRSPRSTPPPTRSVFAKA
jgi:hypothetical protein